MLPEVVVSPGFMPPDFIMSGCAFIIFTQPVSFIMASWLMAVQAFIRCMSLLDILSIGLVMPPLLALLLGGVELYWAEAAPAASASAEPAIAASCRSFIGSLPSTAERGPAG